jgi:hypothetical protein
MIKTMETLSQAMNLLHQKGYIEDFNLKPDGLHCVSRRFDIEPDAFQIDAVYRFEGMSDPGDEEILFAISSNKYELKGLLVNSYGVYADALTTAMEQKLNIRNYT